MGRMGVKFFEPPSSSFQGGRHISHQASLLPEERGCNRTQCCFSKIIPSFFTIKEGSTFLTKPLFPQEREDVTALRCSEPLRSKVGGPSKVFAMLCGMGPPGVRWGIGWVLPCCKAWWQRMVIELGLSSGYLMVGLLFPAKFIAE